MNWLRGTNLIETMEKGRLAMPTETAVIIAGIILVFSLFAVALVWADYYTRNSRTPGAAYFIEGRKVS
jgi:hypothetical protein